MKSHLTREQIVDLVRKLLNAEGTEEEQDAWLKLIEKSVPHPGLSDLIYYPDVPLTAEEIVDIALRYQPLRIQSGSGKAEPQQ